MLYSSTLPATAASHAWAALTGDDAWAVLCDLREGIDRTSGAFTLTAHRSTCEATIANPDGFQIL